VAAAELDRVVEARRHRRSTRTTLTQHRQVAEEHLAQLAVLDGQAVLSASDNQTFFSQPLWPTSDWTL